MKIGMLAVSVSSRIVVSTADTVFLRSLTHAIRVRKGHTVVLDVIAATARSYSVHK